MKHFLFLLVIPAVYQLASAQNIGIGTLTPLRAKLEVEGSVGATSAIFGGESSGISLQRNWPGIGFNQYYAFFGKYIANGHAGVQYLDPNNGGIYFDLFPYGTANNPNGTALRTLSLLPSGNVGIRGAYANATLSVARGTGTEGTALFYGTQWSSHFNYSTTENTYIRAGKNNSHVYINDIPGGNIFLGGGSSRVGINTNSPVYTLEIRQVNGKGFILIDPNWGFRGWELRCDPYNSDPNNPQSALTLFYNGRANPIMGWFRPDNGSYSSNSDLRLKTNIQQLAPVLNRVLQLNPVSYQMIGNPGQEVTFGLIAQEAKGLFPEMVDIINKNKTPGDGSLPDQHGINYAGFSIVAIKAIQEQQQLIQLQQQQIKALEKRLALIEQRME